jgi:hypothetical protein
MLSCSPLIHTCWLPNKLIGALAAAVLLQNADRLDSEIIYDRDFDYDYFGFKVSLLLCDACMFKLLQHVQSSWLHDYLGTHAFERSAKHKCPACSEVIHLLHREEGYAMANVSHHAAFCVRHQHRMPYIVSRYAVIVVVLSSTLTASTV